MPPVAKAEWRRLDQPGHHPCVLVAGACAWQLAGTAASRDPDGDQLDCEVSCGQGWRTRQTRITGRSASQDIRLHIVQTDGNRTLNDAPQPQVAGLADLDLCFTPATGTLPISRLTRRPRETRGTAAAWLTPDFRRAPLRQEYEAAEGGGFHYASPDHDFRTRLTVHRSGLVGDYPGLSTGEVSDA